MKNELIVEMKKRKSKDSKEVKLYEEKLFTLFLLTLLIFGTSLSNTVPKINFIYKDKIIPFKEKPIITEKEIYFSVEDFGILMKFVGFID